MARKNCIFSVKSRCCQSRSWQQFWLFSILGLFFALSIVEAWIQAIPATCPDCSARRIRGHVPTSSTLYSKKAEEDDPEKEKIKPRGAFTFLGVSKDDNKKQTTKKPTRSTTNDDDDDSKGFFRSVSRRFESRKSKSKTKLDEKLKRELDSETANTSSSGFLPVFNTTGLSSAFQNVTNGFTEAGEGLRNVRANSKTLSEEEKRIEEIRKRNEIEKKKRIISQQLSDQRSVERRERKRKEREAQSAVKGVVEADSSRMGSDEEKNRSKTPGVAQKVFSKPSKRQDNGQGKRDGEKQRSSSLSVSQKLLGGIFDSPKEKWIVVAPKTRISPGEIVPITVAGLDLLLVATVDGSALYCIANSCPHLGTPLEVGLQERRPIEQSDVSVANVKGLNGSSGKKNEGRSKDGCEDCIVCPLHKTAFALGSGEVRGEWCPYPPVLGKVVGAVKTQASLAVFDVRTRGKNIEVRLSSPFEALNE